MSNSKPVVRFLQNAQVQGTGYLRGQSAMLDAEVAQVYVEQGQAEYVASARDLEPSRRTTKRKGKAAETTSKKGGEKR